MQATNQSVLHNIPSVIISPSGKFKYILIQAKVQENNKQTQVYFVRGDIKEEYHADNFKKFIAELKGNGFQIKKKSVDAGNFEAVKGHTRLLVKCPGGGRIQHNHQGHKCFIYGYSKSYGLVDHTIAQKMIAKQLGYSLADIKTSQQGY